MNRLVLIGNGFDLAHGLPTSYKDFINWYWDQRMHGFYQPDKPNAKVSEDILCKFEILSIDETWSTFAYKHNYFRTDSEFPIKYVGKDIIEEIKQVSDVEDVTYKGVKELAESSIKYLLKVVFAVLFLILLPLYDLIHKIFPSFLWLYLLI